MLPILGPAVAAQLLGHEQPQFAVGEDFDLAGVSFEDRDGLGDLPAAFLLYFRLEGRARRRGF